jgi:signal transduction histidine kinase
VPTLSDITELVSMARAAGLEVDDDIEVMDVPAVVGVTAYRLVQEAITNSTRHSAARRVAVRVHPSGDGISVVVDDPGPARSDTTTNSGHGLIGMRERDLGVGGRLTAAPTPAGGFRVDAWIPTGHGES